MRAVAGVIFCFLGGTRVTFDSKSFENLKRIARKEVTLSIKEIATVVVLAGG